MVICVNHIKTKLGTEKSMDANILNDFFLLEVWYMKQHKNLNRVFKQYRYCFFFKHKTDPHYFNHCYARFF